MLLHACAHNPTGVDPTLDQWKVLRNADVPPRLLLDSQCCAAISCRTLHVGLLTQPSDATLLDMQGILKVVQQRRCAASCTRSCCEGFWLSCCSTASVCNQSLRSRLMLCVNPQAAALLRLGISGLCHWQPGV